MRNAPYNSTRNSNESWNANEIERMKFHRTSVEDKGYSQSWMKKTRQLDFGNHHNGNGH